MKKSLIALAVAGALTAPMVAQADATLYGKFEMRVKSVTNADLEIESDDFRFGVKGDSAIGDGSTRALFKLEMELNPDDDATTDTGRADTFSSSITQRDAYVGATGDWGTALIGRIPNPAEQIVSMTGNYSESAAFSYDLNSDRLGSAVSYMTPDLSGFNGYLAVVAEGQGDDAEDDADGVVVGGSFATGGLTLAAAYSSFTDTFEDATDDLELTQLGASYSFGATTVAAMVAEQEGEPGSDNKDVWGVFAKQNIGDDLAVYANYHNVETEVVGAADTESDEYSIGASYALGAQATVDIEWVNFDDDAAAEDIDIVSVGYVVKF